MKRLVRRAAASNRQSSPFIAALESPVEGSVLSETIPVVGWVFSQENRIDRVEALLDGTALGALHHGSERPDVAAAYAHAAALRSGYNAVFSVPAGTADGAHSLVVRVIDAAQRTEEYRRSIQIVRSPLNTALDAPAEGSSLVDVVDVSGWAFSNDALITEVYATLGGGTRCALRYGIERPDVATAFPNRAPRACGFAGCLPIDPGTSGPTNLTVQITDARGHQQEITRTVSVRLQGVRLDGAGETTEVGVPARIVMPHHSAKVQGDEAALERISLIEASLDVPAEDSTVAGVVEVSGWAFSLDAPIVAVEASVDGTAASALQCGLERADVATAFPNRAPLQCGYHGQLSLDPSAAGPVTLRVRIVDGRGNQRDITRPVSARAARVRMWVDMPEAESVSGGTLVIRGWAFSRGARIVEVQAWLGNRAHTVLAHGFYRRDVVAALTDPEAERSGFEGVLNFEPSKMQRSERLVVHARDELGEIAGVEVPIRIAMPREPLCEIERVRWREARLEVDGWVAWPESTPPLRILVFVGERLAGETSPNRSRPDLKRRFPAYPARSFRGFRLSASLDPGETLVGDRSALVIECVDGEGKRIRRTTSIVHEPRAGTAGVSCDALPKIEQAVASVHTRLQHEPTILDWQTGLDLGAALPHSVVFSPPSTDAPTLPYLDHSVDIVVVKADGAARVAEAHRVAAVATVEIYAGAEASHPKVSWEHGAPPPPPVVTTSIIIPVHDQVKYTDACLKQLLATLPAEFRGEIIVVDDASTDDTPTVLSRWAESSPLLRVLRNDENDGFLQSCNRAAEAASGEVLVFLNNDTLPQPGWLAPLVRQLRDDPSAGAVGGKLVYADGTLQEAGGVIFSDGSGYNFGRHDAHPNGPLYSFVREVDYCSGALLAIRRSVFRDVGGFDVRFSPAYYEDTDLCFRLREKGYRVYYQPESAVVHFEGTTAGTDLQAGVKRYQTVNREKFVERWRTVLKSQPAPPVNFDAAARQALSVRDGRPRALVCAPRMPEYDREGGSQRVFHLIEFLRASGWAVSFVALNATGSDRYVRLLQQRGVATYAGPEALLAGDEYLDDLDELIATGKFDLAIPVFWDIGEQLIPRIRSLSPQTRVIVDSIDLHFLRSARSVLHRSSGHERGTLGGDYADRMIREMNAYTAADAVLTVSQKEADLINDMAADHALAYSVPLMEDLPRSPFDFGQRNGLLFIGNFRHPPNLEGLKYLCSAILPRVTPALRAAHPLWVVGNELDDRVRAAVEGVEHVRLVGWVPSLTPYLARARASVIPLLHGAGTKTKLIQALMVGTPSVSTLVGIEGLGLEDREHVLVAESPRDFAEHLSSLLEDPELWHRLAAQGRTHIDQAHGREAVCARFLSVVKRVMGQPAAAAY
jgi:GT2 family glycosyltransferase